MRRGQKRRGGQQPARPACTRGSPSGCIQGLQAGRSEEPNPYLELTDRELDVLRLIAEGLSNTEITRWLVISENTVKGRVSNILSKLHLAVRTQAVLYAWKQGWVRGD